MDQANSEDDDADTNGGKPGAAMDARAAEPSYDLRVMRALRRINRSVDLYSNRLAQQHGVTAPQLICILKIAEAGAITVKDLAEDVYLSRSTVVGIADRLEGRGLLTRSRCLKDRRVVRLALTDSGRAMAADSPSPLQDSLARGLADLSELERAATMQTLERIIELMERPRAADDRDGPGLGGAEGGQGDWPEALPLAAAKGV